MLVHRAELAHFQASMLFVATCTASKPPRPHSCLAKAVQTQRAASIAAALLPLTSMLRCRSLISAHESAGLIRAGTHWTARGRRTTTCTRQALPTLRALYSKWYSKRLESRRLEHNRYFSIRGPGAPKEVDWNFHPVSAPETEGFRS